MFCQPPHTVWALKHELDNNSNHSPKRRRCGEMEVTLDEASSHLPPKEPECLHKGQIPDSPVTPQWVAEPVRIPALRDTGAS